MARSDNKTAASNSLNDAITRTFNAYSDKEAIRQICNTILEKVTITEIALEKMDGKDLTNLKSTLENRLKEIDTEIAIRAGLTKRKEEAIEKK